ncbi:unnamed protein product [Psylliodes chrysocephalus]|uniref:Peptidase C1A papain C-terminal domain-containing protein n=1 Tax=Psylliodes chrysocephalus TaxID=3402493 RepID=A0A9P0G9G3_9CUCU|nr:unnamed protein product [Psylliodes chrysocephala]
MLGGTELDDFITFIAPANVKMPEEVVWRTQKAVTAVKDQGHYVSCWSFSAIGSPKGQHNKKLENSFLYPNKTWSTAPLNMVTMIATVDLWTTPSVTSKTTVVLTQKLLIHTKLKMKSAITTPKVQGIH